MKIACFYHSLISDWNHGNAHFLRGVVSELIERGHDVVVFEPVDAWSVDNLIRDQGIGALAGFHAVYPRLRSRFHGNGLDLDEALDGVDLVIVHEWNQPALVARLGEHRARTRRYQLLFHDTHHRAVTAPAEMAAFDLSHYDGVLAFGEIIRQLYLERSWIQRAWTWHEAADIRVFAPRLGEDHDGDLAWVGNWGDDERSDELRRFLLEPVVALGLRAGVWGVRYPEHGRRALVDAGIAYGGWLPNHRVPEVFARHRVTIHVPRRPYAEALPGIPTIRPFEAMACGIPLVCSPWQDSEGLFTAGQDYLVARDGAEMRRHLRDVLEDDQLARTLVSNGRRTILDRHTCGHRVDQLLEISSQL